MADPFDVTGTEQQGSPDVWRNLLSFGLATMAAGSQPGARTLGALGQGGLAAMESARQNAQARAQIQASQASTAGSNLSNATNLLGINMRNHAFGMQPLSMPGVPNLMPQGGVMGGQQPQQSPGYQGTDQQQPQPQGQDNLSPQANAGALSQYRSQNGMGNPPGWSQQMGQGGAGEDQAQMAGNKQSGQNEQLGNASSTPQAGSVGPSWGPTMGSAPNQNTGQVAYMNGSSKGVNMDRVMKLAYGAISPQQASEDEIAAAIPWAQGQQAEMLRTLYTQHMAPQTIRSANGSVNYDPLTGQVLQVPEFRESQGPGGRETTSPHAVGLVRSNINGGPVENLPNGSTSYPPAQPSPQSQGGAVGNQIPTRQASFMPPQPQGTDNAGMPIMPGSANVDQGQAQQFAQDNQAAFSRAGASPGGGQPQAQGGGNANPLQIPEPANAIVPVRNAPAPNSTDSEAFVSKLGPGEDEQIKELAKNFTNAEHGGELHNYNNALQMKATIQQLRGDLSEMGDQDWLAQGAGAEKRINIANQLNTLNRMVGGNGDIVDPNTLSGATAAQKLHTLLGAQATNQYFGASHEAASIITSMTAANPGPNISPESNKLILDGQEEAANYAADLYQFKQKYSDANNGDLRGSDVAFNQQFPPKKYAIRALSQQKPVDVNAGVPGAMKQFLPGTRIAIHYADGSTKIRKIAGQDLGTGAPVVGQQSAAQQPQQQGQGQPQ